MASAMQYEEQQLIFIPGPGMGHIVSAVEIAKLIFNRESRLSITFLLIKDSQVDQYTHSLQISDNQRLRFINLPEVELEPSSSPKLPPLLASQHIDRHKPLVREALLAITKSEETRVAGLIMDVFCINMTDVANDFKIPSYVFFTSSSSFLSMMLFFQSLTDDHGEDITEFKNSNREFLIPGFVNPVPAKVMPSMMLDKNGGSELVMSTARRIRETRGVIINTFQELETTAIKALSDSNGKIPPIYPIGPVINLNTKSENQDSIISWLDKQPSSSVLFLCFGSQGSFIDAQIKHLATALEFSGHRFLWSLRRRKPDKKTAETTDSTSPDEILPKDFLQRTSRIGRVIRWAPQVAVLSHPAIGGFFSHCGWNSILESLWFGVPIAAWPLAAEQQANAFQMVVEMGMAIEIKMDYRNDISDEIVVGAEEIERAINQLMVDEDVDGMRKKVKDMRGKSSRALIEGGSSYRFLGCLIHDIMHNSMEQIS